MRTCQEKIECTQMKLRKRPTKENLHENEMFEEEWNKKRTKENLYEKEK